MIQSCNCGYYHHKNWQKGFYGVFFCKIMAKLCFSKLGQGSRSNREKMVKPNFGLIYVVFGIKIQGFDYLLHIKGFQMH